MTSYISDVATISQTITDLGTIVTAFGTNLPGPILSFVIPFAMLGAILGLLYAIVGVLPKILSSVIRKV